ncbi:MAG: autotransporter domain-containing protein [Rhodocyclaceae bacterium]|nr:autotransporter domain-containing protein [Rhodocyclaceae bacterium]
MQRTSFPLKPLAAALAAAWAGVAAAQSTTTRATGVSGDGSTVVGYISTASGGQAYKWTESGGLVTLGIPGNSAARGVSNNGSVIVGTSYGSPLRAFVWNNGSISYITVDGSDVYGNAVSSNGSVVVGGVYNSGSNTGYAYRWTSSGGLENLGKLTGDAEAVATAVNSNGSVVVGTSYGTYGANPKAFRWTSSGMTGLGNLTGKTKSEATGVSGDGSIVVGSSYSNDDKSDALAFRWTSSGMTSLNTLGGSASWANAISADGNVIVGDSYDSSNQLRGFRWASNSMQSITDWLASAGVTVGSGIVPRTANATNADGCVVVGELDNGEAYVARAGCSSGSNKITAINGGGSGLISVQQISNTLTQAAANVGITLQSVGVVLHGAHSRPLSRRVEAGKHAFWVAGDLGRDEHGERDGNLGLAEVGLGRNFGPLQVNAALGHTWSKFAQPLDSHIKHEGSFLFAEGLLPLSGGKDDGLWAVLMGYHHWGDAKIRRGYLNAGLPDHSTGQPGVRSWAVSLGLEWQNLVKSADFSLSPYANLTHTRAKVDAYTETGGAWPAAFAGRSESTNDLRIGANAVKTLGAAKLLGTLEATHRFEDRAAAATATILGPGGFTVTVPGQSYERTWLRAGLGIEGKLGGGQGSLMLNATSRGEMPSYWLAASWRMAF